VANRARTYASRSLVSVARLGDQNRKKEPCQTRHVTTLTPGETPQP